MGDSQSQIAGGEATEAEGAASLAQGRDSHDGAACGRGDSPLVVGAGDAGAGAPIASSTGGGGGTAPTGPDRSPNSTADKSETMPSESDILSRLVVVLGNCPTRSMELAQIREKLPPALRRVAEDTDNICKWLRGFPGLLEVSGPPGKELVVLTVGKIGRVDSPDGGASRSDHASPGGTLPPSPTTNAAFNGGNAVGANANINNCLLQNDDDENPATVQLRGLPFRATIGDIKTFLGDHCVGLARDEPNIRLLLNRDGRPSGFARVHFATPQAAQVAREALHKKHMGDRFVEVLACTERGGKLRHRPAPNPESTGAEDAEQEYVERERILEECRQHMRQPGRQCLLLSMLGIALSAPARNYLRKTNLGLKHFLARVPNEFRVEGQKGCERVHWCCGGAMMDPSAFAAMGMMPWGLDVEMPGTPDQSSSGMALPTSSESGGPCAATPSAWGTPTPTVAGLANVSANDIAAMMAFQNPWFPGAYPGGWGVGWDGTWSSEATGAGTELGGKGGGKDAAKAADKAKRGTRNEAAAATRSHAHLHPQSHPYLNRPGDVSPAVVGTEETNLATTKLPTLRLRGLPFSVTVQDVLAFFAQHEVADRIADGPNVAELLPKANGRPSGQAVVLMRSFQDATEARDALASKWIGGRWIEVFVYGEEEDGQNNESDHDTGDGHSRPASTTSAANGINGMSAEMLANMSAPWIPWVGLPPPPTTNTTGQGPTETPEWLNTIGVPWGNAPAPPWAQQQQLGGAADGDIAAARGALPGGSRSVSRPLAHDARSQTLQV